MRPFAFVYLVDLQWKMRHSVPRSGERVRRAGCRFFPMCRPGIASACAAGGVVAPPQAMLTAAGLPDGQITSVLPNHVKAPEWKIFCFTEIKSVAAASRDLHHRTKNAHSVRR